MIRNRAGLAALAASLVVGLGSAAYAQTAQPPDQNVRTHDATNAQGNANTNKIDTKQDRFERDRTALKDRVQKSMDQADADIRDLQNFDFSTKTAAEKKKATDEQKKLSDAKDRLNDDMSKIDKATMNDWNKLKPAVQRDLNSFNMESKRVAAITKAAPRRGVANPQPNAPSEPSTPSNPYKK